MSPEFPFRTLDDIELEGKTAIVRIDVNSPVEQGRVHLSERIKEHGKALRELSQTGVKAILLAHQGRPGDPDFTTLEQHARLLSECGGVEVDYVRDVIGERALRRIQSLKPGELLLLENVRTVPGETETRSPEEHSRGPLAQTLAPHAQLYINDAFATSHRSHASVVGFAPLLPSVAGRLTERELRHLEKVRRPERPCLYLLGGAKAADSFRVMNHAAREGNTDAILTCGIVGNIFLWSAARQGSAFEQFYKDAENLRPKVRVPLDVAIEVDGQRVEIPASQLRTEHRAYDIGQKTIEAYAREISKAKTIIASGPPGKYESPPFSLGTRKLLDAVSKSKAFTVIGGGDSVSAIEAVGLSKEAYSYVGLGGHALLDYICGESLPGIETLRRTPRKK